MALAEPAAGSCSPALPSSHLSAALAAHDHLSAPVIRGFDSLNQGVLSLSSLPAVLLFAAAGTAFLHDPSAPRWLTTLTLVGVPLALLDASSYDGGPLAAVGIIGLAYFLIWSLTTATYLTRTTTTTTTTTTVEQTAPAMVGE